MSVAGTAALIKTILGGAQMIGGGIMGARNKRPTFEIPEAATQALGLARAQAGSDVLPAQGLFENLIAESSGDSMAASRAGAQNPAQVLEQALGINKNRNKSLTQLAISGMDRKDRNISQLQSAMGAMAGWQKMQFDINEMQPFLERAGTASSLLGAGMQNTLGAIDSYGATKIGDAELQQVLAELKKLQEGGGETMTQAINGAE